MRVKDSWCLNFQLPILPAESLKTENTAMTCIYNPVIWLEVSSAVSSGRSILRNENQNRTVWIEMGLSNKLLRTWRMVKNLDLNHSLSRHLPTPWISLCPEWVFSMCFGPDCTQDTKHTALEAGMASFR